MSKFEKKRMSMLLGDKRSVSSTDVEDPPKHHISLTEAKSSRPKPEKLHLFSDYKYITMKAQKGNSVERVSFPCFKDTLIFPNDLPSCHLYYDNDQQSDDEQIRECKRRMISELKV